MKFENLFEQLNNDLIKRIRNAGIEVYDDDPQGQLIVTNGLSLEEVRERLRNAGISISTDYDDSKDKVYINKPYGLNESPKKIKITNITISEKWIYDTWKGGVDIECKINGIPLKFPFRACYGGDPFFLGIDCDEAHTSDRKWVRISTPGSGMNRSFELRVSDRILKSKPKENQKNFSFTGTIYSTEPIKSEFKRKLLSMYDEGTLSDKFLKLIGC